MSKLTKNADVDVMFLVRFIFVFDFIILYDYSFLYSMSKFHVGNVPTIFNTCWIIIINMGLVRILSDQAHGLHEFIKILFTYIN